MVKVKELKEGDTILMKFGRNRFEILTVLEDYPKNSLIKTLEKGEIRVYYEEIERLGTKEMKPEIFLHAENVTLILGKYWKNKHQKLTEDELRMLDSALHSTIVEYETLFAKKIIKEKLLTDFKARAESIRYKIGIPDFEMPF